MVHHFNGEAWKQLNRMHPQILMEPQNLHVRLYTKGFNPFRLFSAPYSCQSVILVVYNLQSKICIRLKFIILSMIILGPNSPGKNIDVFLRPLIDELKQLRLFKTLIYDVSKKHNFQMKTTLMWTINNFPAYRMVSG